MKATSYLSIEISDKCNLSRYHKECPASCTDRWSDPSLTKDRYITDEDVFSIVSAAYKEHGFRGWVAFHYYNEPLLEWYYLFRIVESIIERVPMARFALWTNGTLIPPNPAMLRLFEHVCVTEYPEMPTHHMDALRRVVPWAVLTGNKLDGRLVNGGGEPGRCFMQFNELVIDHYGNVHICCMDWRHGIGNVFKEPLADLVKRFNAIRECNVKGCSEQPEFCKNCRYKTLRPHWHDAETQDRIVTAIQQICGSDYRIRVAQ